jgi:acetate kinase
MSMRVLVVNAGSSSLKLRVLEQDDTVVASKDLPPPDGLSGTSLVEHAIRELGPVDAVGHRVVHGGTEFSSAVLIDPEVERRLHALTDLAPLHQPKSLAALDAANAALPSVPAVACFDTAFHVNLPAAAASYALPEEWRSRWAIRRYGFHGLSHAYISQRAASVLGRQVESLRLVTCHLGAGGSLCAVNGGRSVDTTMGFTPLDGLVMATRSGSVDPGLVLWLEEHAGISPAELADTLENRSGLLGLGGDSDMRSLLRRSGRDDPAASLAIGVYLHRLRAGIASMAAAMDGLDALVFSGGVGENSPPIRAACCDGLGFLGVSIDLNGHDSGCGDRVISPPDMTTSVLVVESREDVQIARETRHLLLG